MGQRIGDRYELVSILGEGGMGVVWRARDTRLGRVVAVKLLPAAAVGSDVARARLIREARAAAALEHHGIVRVYDVGEIEEGGAFLVMELIRGQSFRALLDKGSLAPAARAAVIVEAAHALHFAHASGIVHRDVKPDNIVLGDDGRVTLVDFGVAKPVATELLANAETLAGVTGAALTWAGQLVGTPAYFAPEQASGADVGMATDQFALAVTAFEAMSGRLPWKGKTAVEVIASVLRDEPPLLSSCADVPPELDRVLARAMAKDPADRFPDMNAFAIAFEQAADGLPEDPSFAIVRRGGPSKRPPSGPRSQENNDGDAKQGGARRAATASTYGGATTMPGAAKTSRSMRLFVLATAGFWIVAFAVWFVGRSRSSETKPAEDKVASGAVGSASEVRVIACPGFETQDADDAWLGAAAAMLACERFAIARGGIDGSVLVPAELLDAPRDVVQNFPIGLVERPESRQKAIERGKQRADRWLDGRLEKAADGFAVKVTLRAADGGEVARAQGRGFEIYEAVRDAMNPILAALPPLGSPEIAGFQAWSDVNSVDEALHLLDVRTAILIEDPVSLKHECEAAARLGTFVPRVAYLMKAMCAKKLRTGKLEEKPPALDESTPGALLTTALAMGTEGGPEAVRSRAMRLEKAHDAESMPEMRARFAAAAAEIYNLIGDGRARKLARMAIQASPKAIDWRTSAWHRLAFSSEGDAWFGASMATWQTWEPISQTLRVSGSDFSNPKTLSDYSRRSYMLSQRGYYANQYGSALLSQGQNEAARGVAEATNDDVLRMELLLGEAKYAEALRTVPKLLDGLVPSDENAATAFRLAQIGVRASMTLGRPADFVDGVVVRFVESEPHHVIDGVVPFVSLVTACCFAPKKTGQRCITRLQELRSSGRLPTIFNSSDTVIQGASSFIEGDDAGAAKAWRTMLRAPGWIQDPMREPMAIAFDRSGAPELADEVDAPLLAFLTVPRTAELAWVRAAKRAHKRDDSKRARELATAVIDKWRFADEDIPAVAEMKDLLATTR